MLEEGRVDIIASDAHNTHARMPGLSKARDMIAERYGDKLANDLVVHKPARILENQLVTTAHSEYVRPVSETRKPRRKSVRLGRFVEWIRNA